MKRQVLHIDRSRSMLSSSQISDLCIKLASLLHAGLGVSQSARLMHPEDSLMQQAVEALSLGGDQGLPLSHIIRETGLFPAYVPGLLEAGEMAGREEESLRALAEYYRRQDMRMRQIKSSLAYPAVLLAMMLGVLAVLMVKVLPVFDGVYASLGGSLDGIGAALLRFGGFIQDAAPVLLVLFGILVSVLLIVLFVAPVRERIWNLYRERFGDRGIFRKMGDARLSQALSLGLSAGTPFEDSLELAGRLLSDMPRAAVRCRDCRERLLSGEPLLQGLYGSGILDRGSCELLYLGMQAGTGDEAMQEVARRKSIEADEAVDGLVAKVEPALVLGSSLLVGIILLSVMLPLMDIMSVIG